ncbi:hypothetical protein ITX44_20355 [Streptomyces sp. KK5PA1]|uniref:Uncharacterized protein n=1 Tax=Actinacidiphila acididurans TaxID=2784346 RepID=A0ABS2TU52_9ACTN|nr:hypothetical protein [Actinacidiphila acididurans]
MSLGAGVQSSTLLLLAAEGRLPALDAAVFADTRWEPRAVYEHLDRLEREVAEPAGIPIPRVSAGHIRDHALNLDQAPIDHVSAHEWAGRQATLDEEAADVLEHGAAEGCSPWSCPGGDPAAEGFDLTA